LELVTYILAGCILGPAVEDLVFIGLLYNGLRTRLNLVLSVLIVASLFALAHGWISLGLIIQFVGGLLFTLSFEFSGSLLTPIIIHWSGNLALLAVQLL
jgi:membrane protease YdiL (CAAX protease family)